ncbi:MAG: DUF3987 domain-containing protein, partial [Phycisphaerae bacterium]|nr:DUF3987 domain-containing protein [Phycisphaerae bacterium]
MTTLPDIADLASAAHSHHGAGLCVLPALLGEKRPSLSAWKAYQTCPPSTTQMEQWFSSPSVEAMCLLTGAVSGNLELLDFDCQAEVFESWRELVEAESPGLLARLVIERSQSGGKHVVYHYEGAVPGSMKLAEKVCVAPDPDSAMYQGKKYVVRRVGECCEFYPVLVETRGEGSLFLCAPSCGYVLEQGSFERLPVITEAEREVLIRCARSFNERVEMAPPPKLPATPGDRPGDDFNERGDVRGVLRRHGWTLVRRGDNECWRRPGKDHGWSATYNGHVLYCFTSSAPPFEPNRGYSKFQVYALLEHGGDYSMAASVLRAQGYGDPPSTPSQQAEAQVTYPDPLPLDDPRPPAMPSGLLAGWLGQMAEQIAEATETPLELPASLCLSVVATAAQGRFSIRPEPGYFEPLNIWTAPAMKSGQRKTAVHKLATAPLLDWERQQCKAMAAAIKEAESQAKTIIARISKLRAKCAS